MRVSHVTGVALGCILMLAPAARTRAEEPSAPAGSDPLQPPRVAAPPAEQDLAAGAEPERAEHRIGILAASDGDRSGAVFRRGAAVAVMVTAIENAPHGPGTEPPMWGDPSGIDLRAAASAIHP